MNLKNAKLKASETCHNLIAGYEGLRLKAYLCPSKVWTIGRGHTGPEVCQGMVINEATADHWFNLDIQKAENTVKAFVEVPLTQNQFDALVSFVFNVGRGNFQTSTLLRLLNAKNYAAVPAQLNRWVYGGQKQKLPGLVARREREAELWSNGKL